MVGAGTIGMCNLTGVGTFDEQTAMLIDQVVAEHPDAKVFAIEPMAHQDIDSIGFVATYEECYGTSWGRHLDRTFTAPGTGDGLKWDSYFAYFGDKAGPAGQGYYSFDVGAWHVIVLNSNGGYEAGSGQLQWLEADLQANASKKCTMAIWDRAHFYGTASQSLMPNNEMSAVWNMLAQYGADLVVNGSHRSWQYYERYAPMNTAGEKDEAAGMRQFIVGTGGRFWNQTLPAAHPSVEVRERVSRGVLKLTLDAESYSWKFMSAGTSTFSDEGTTACH
jgi:hypothetical protein